MTVVAIVPAKDSGARVGATVSALRGLDGVDRVLVVDDGSTDDTTEVARLAGAEVLRLPTNRGKAAAVAAGVEVALEADVLLLVDADLEDTAALADGLLAPVLADEADLAIAVLPAAGRRGGFGNVRKLAAAGIRRACGFEPRAPLSGQRAVRARFLHDMEAAERFGLEVAMTIDVCRAGGRIVEVDVPMDHRHTGRRPTGFAHRGRQGADIVRALWPRLTTSRQRTGLILTATIVFAVAMLWGGAQAVPSSVAPARDPAKVLLVGVPRVGLDDLERDDLPELRALARDGAAGAMSVRTLSGRPTSTEAYATISAGTRVKARIEALALPADGAYEGTTAKAVLERRTGRVVTGEVVLVSLPALLDGAGSDISSEPGALGDALHEAGLRTAVVGSADRVDERGALVVSRPVAIAAIDSGGSVDHGTVTGGDLLLDDDRAPFGRRADVRDVVAETEAALAQADLVVVDTGDTDRAAAYAPLTTPAQSEALRRQAMRTVDALLGELRRNLDDDTLLLVVGLTPPTAEWELAPLVAYGAGVERGLVHSTSTKREGLVTLTDVTTTVLDSLGVEIPEGMIGAPLRYHPGDGSLSDLRDLNEIATAREGVYFPATLTFIIVQAIGYVFAILALRQGAHRHRLAGWLTLLVLAFASWPLATFVLRAVPSGYDLGSGGTAVLLLALSVVIGALAMRARRHALSPVAWICGLTAVIQVVDVATGAHLQMASILGYSPHTAARFTGYGNTAFAVLAATAVLVAAIHVHYAPRRQEALLASACFLGLVVVADGAPTLGSDVGGIITLVPVFGLLVLVMSGRRVTWRLVVLAAGLTVLVLAAATVVDLLRPEGERTHLGDFASKVLEGESGAWTTINRKWATNIRVFRTTIWTWMVPVTAVFLVWLLVISDGWRRLLPPRSAVRAGILGCLGAGVLGWLVNDSGVVVTALVFVYAGPYLTLLALDGERPAPTLLPPAEPALVPAAGA